MVIVGVHSGSFHTDEVFAVAILKLIYPELKVVRTRDFEKLKKADFRVDVGWIYNHKTRDYDHHQKSFKEKRENGVPYASAGLIWKHYGRKLIKSRDGFDYIDEKIIQPIDAHDTGYDYYDSKIIEPFTVGHVIRAFSPVWTVSSNFNKEFNAAVRFAQSLLIRLIKYAESIDVANKHVRDAVKKSDGKILFLSSPAPPWDKILVEETKIKFVVYKLTNGLWGAKGVPKKLGNFELRKPFPKSWGGLVDEELARVSGVSDATFCHKGLFIVCAKSKKGILELVNIALNN
jgi:uncharacterized UPF0160 family protein